MRIKAGQWWALLSQLAFPSPVISREIPCSPSLFRDTIGISYPRGRAPLGYGWYVGAGREEAPTQAKHCNRGWWYELEDQEKVASSTTPGPLSSASALHE